jgi:hypothetical protein
MHARLRASLVLALLALGGALFFWLQNDERPSVVHTEKEPLSGALAENSAAGAATGNAAPPGPGSKQQRAAADLVEIQWARGSGYALGNQIKNVFDHATVLNDGTKHLDLSTLAIDFTSGKRLVPLEDPLVRAEVRAEYMAAVLTAALGEPVSKQAEFARLLVSLYEADSKNNPKAADANPASFQASIEPGPRIELSEKARQLLLSAIPVEMHSRLREITAASQFLFRGASFRARSITFDQHATRLKASDATVSFDSKKGINVEGKNVITMKDPAPASGDKLSR